ncbi:hypothetical protein IW148_000176 [Coemansia sp. RSA 1199]|nr:hypothetical protein IW148_000176 [Coemansia sp. RSA 1199]
MPNCSSSANADKIAELKNEIDNIKWLVNNNIADSNDVAHKTMEYATKLETLSSQMSNLPVELFEYSPAADALTADHTAKDTVVEPDSSAGDTNSDDSDGTVAGTSTAKSDDKTGVWQTVVAKRNPHATNCGQKKAKRNRKAKK